MKNFVELNQERLMRDNVIKNIRFTQAEIKVLSCFVSNITKSKSIGTILGSSPKTIDTHIDNIKRKINTNNKEDIYLFIKSSTEFNQLKIIFNQVYVNYKYKQAVKKIAYKLKTLSITCNFNVSAELNKNTDINEISQTIKLAGIKINNIDNLLSLQTVSSNLKSNQFYLFVIHNIDEIRSLRECIKISDHNILYICFNKPLEETEEFKNKVLFYNKVDKEIFYQGFLSYLIRTYKIFDKEDEILVFLSSIDNYIQPEIEANEQDFSKNKKNIKQNSSFFSTLTVQKWVIIIILLISGITSIIYIFNYNNSSIKTPTINIGTSNLKRDTTSEVFVYNLPQININFTGRSDDFMAIKNNFLKENIGVITQAIVGSGGIGKTQLATEFAYRSINNREYDAVLWITADSYNKINDTYIELADRLNINIDNLNSTAIKKVIHNELIERYKIKKILFILDNVSQEEEIEPFLTELRGQWPIDSKTHVLISTRNQHFSFPSLILDVFTQKEALLFIKKHLAYENEQNIIKLIELLHYYPLALEQAVGYIKQHTNIKDYIEMYNNKTQRYLNLFSGNIDEHQETLWKTVFISLSKLSNNAKEMLYISTYFESNDIQLDFFNQFTVEQRAKAIKELREHSFITMSKNRQSFKIHILVQEIIRLMIKDNTIWLNKTMALAKKGVGSFDSKNRATWDNARNWLYHITSICKYLPKTSATAELLDSYSNIARHFGLYNLTHELLINSLHIKEQSYKDINNIKLIDTLNNLGSIELSLAHYDKAKELYKKILKIQEIYYKKPDHIKLSETLNNLGSVETLQGNYDKAKEIYQQALKIKEDYYQTSNHIGLTDTLEGLGYVEHYFGHYDKAKKLFQKVLKIKVSYYQNSKHIDLANTLSYIGYMDLCLGYYEESKKLQERALTIYNKHYKETNNILMVTFLQRLAVAEWGLGNFDKAISLYNKVLQIKQDHYQDPNHIAIAVTLQGLGMAKFGLGDYVEAKKFLEQDIKIRQKHYQSEEPVAIVSPLHTLGLSEESLGNYDIALTYINKAYAIGNNFFKEQLQNAMASDYTPAIPWPNLKQKNKEQSIDYYKKSLQITKNLFGDEYHLVARYYYLLGQAYEINGKNKQAIEQYEKALTLAKQVTLYINDDSVLARHQQNINIVKNKLIINR
jgi:tetratricopeptide (TPR) repeat protein/DNA-binding CsgD family transcriptional regulator